ncbi:MAG: hypothetical protein J6D36_03500 [Erysipelotrichaceae bacterium]|nr:hypothetical protein [Erysipelotrichaceae bacterium]
MSTIKEIFNLEYDHQPENQKFSLPCWYNTLIDKTLDTLTIDDIGIMIRQDVLFDLAFEKALTILKIDPLSGYKYEGELLEALAVHKGYTDEQKKKLVELIPMLEDFSKRHEFELKEFQDDYLTILNDLKENLNQ